VKPGDLFAAYDVCSDIVSCEVTIRFREVVLVTGRGVGNDGDAVFDIVMQGGPGFARLSSMESEATIEELIRLKRWERIG